jgi:hypothetical protein
VVRQLRPEKCELSVNLRKGDHARLLEQAVRKFGMSGALFL